MSNTREVMGEQETLDALVSGTLENFEDDTLYELADSAFYYHPGIKNVMLPNCTRIGQSAFGNTNIENVELPKCTSLGQYSFQGCYRLKELKIGPVNSVSFGYNCLSSTRRLRHLVVNSSTLPTTFNLGTGSSIGNDEGVLYVPDVLVDSAKTKFPDYRIEPISNYPVSVFSIADSWEEIAAAMEDGTYKEKYHIGDTKTFKLGDQEVIAQIAGFDVDIAADDGLPVPITWITKHAELYDTYGAGTDNRIYANSSIRRKLNETYFPTIDIEEYIVPVVKYSYSYQELTSVSSIESLWLPSVLELWTKESGAQDDYGPTYSELFTDNDSRIKTTTSYNANPYWLRSYSDSSNNIAYVKNDGGYASAQTNSSSYFAFGFCTRHYKRPEYIEDTWAQIKAAELDGTYISKYKVGDKKTINVDGVEIRAQIVGIDKDEAANPGESAHITWMTIDTVGNRQMGSLTNGWGGSSLRTYLINTVLPTIDIKEYIVPVTKYFTTDDAYATNETCTDSIWIPSCREIVGGDDYETVGCSYGEFFDKCGVWDRYSGNSRTSTATRTKKNTNYTIQWGSGGTLSQYNWSNNQNIQIGFCT